MKDTYRIEANISRNAARKLLADLATKDKFRAQVENAPIETLRDFGLIVEGDELPETVTLPPKREIAHLLYTGDSVVPEDASPFGWLVLFVVFGAMPVTTSDQPAAHGAG